MTIQLLFVIGTVAGIACTFFSITALVVTVKMIADNEFYPACFFALGNSIPQIIWGCLSAMALYDVRHLTHGPIDMIMTFVGIAVMLIIAYKLFTSKNKKIKPHKTNAGDGAVKNFFLGLLLSISAPQRVIIYIIIFTGFGVRYNSHTFVKTVTGIGLGTFIGSVLAWAGLVLLFKKLSHSIKVQTLSRTGAVLLVLLALGAFIGLFIN